VSGISWRMRARSSMRAVIQQRDRGADTAVVALARRSVIVWAPVRAAENLWDTPWCRGMEGHLVASV